MSRVEAVERLMQVLSILRASEGYPVPRSRLLANVTAYATSKTDEASVIRKMDHDLNAMRDLGFRIENVAPDGSESAYVLHEGTWLSIALEPAERSLLVWAMAAAGAAGEEEASMTSVPSDLSSLLGVVPRALDLAQAALAGGRSLRLVKDGEEVRFEPGLLAARHGRWFLIGRYDGDPTVKAPRLDRLEVLGLGGPLSAPVEVGDPDEVLDSTAWPSHERREAELHCRPEDLGVVASWFPRANEELLNEETAVLRFWYRNEEALISRVLGLAGVAWVVRPPSAVEAVREQVEAVLGAAS